MVEHHKEFSHLLTNTIEEEFLESKSLAILPEGNIKVCLLCQGLLYFSLVLKPMFQRIGVATMLLWAAFFMANSLKSRGAY